VGETWAIVFARRALALKRLSVFIAESDLLDEVDDTSPQLGVRDTHESLGEG
jgi:hypothetical protein